MLALTRRPLRATDRFTLHNRLDQMMQDMLANTPFWSEQGAVNATWTPVVDVFEGKDAIRIVAELPGVRAQDVKISLENHTLTLRGEKQQETQDTGERTHRYERVFGSFERTFTLPTTVDPDKIEASYADGVLTISIPKVEKARPREIPVTAG